MRFPMSRKQPHGYEHQSLKDTDSEDSRAGDVGAVEKRGWAASFHHKPPKLESHHQPTTIQTLRTRSPAVTASGKKHSPREPVWKRRFRSVKAAAGQDSHHQQQHQQQPVEESARSRPKSAQTNRKTTSGSAADDEAAVTRIETLSMDQSVYSQPVVVVAAASSDSTSSSSYRRERYRKRSKKATSSSECSNNVLKAFGNAQSTVSDIFQEISLTEPDSFTVDTPSVSTNEVSGVSSSYSETDASSSHWTSDTNGRRNKGRCGGGDDAADEFIAAALGGCKVSACSSTIVDELARLWESPTPRHRRRRRPKKQ